MGTGHAFHRRGQSTSRVHFRETPNDEDARADEAPASWLLAPAMNSWKNLLPTREPRLPAERFAVQRRARRRAGSTILHRGPCGELVRCNGLFGSGAGEYESTGQPF